MKLLYAVAVLLDHHFGQRTGVWVNLSAGRQHAPCSWFDAVRISKIKTLLDTALLGSALGFNGRSGSVGVRGLLRATARYKRRTRQE